MPYINISVVDAEPNRDWSENEYCDEIFSDMMCDECFIPGDMSYESVSDSNDYDYLQGIYNSESNEA